MLNEHEHVIDVICWAPPEAAKVIQMAMYNIMNQSVFSQSIAQQEDSGLLNDNDGKMDELEFHNVEVKDATTTVDEEQNMNSKLTTKERI